MSSAERYLTLYDRFGDRIGAGVEIEATLEDLADTLFCTPRNAKLILRKLEETGLIGWLPGRGRGNRSRIVFKVDKESYLLELSQCYAGKADYKTAFEFLQSYGTDTSAKSRFLEWLNGQFGYRKEENLNGISASDVLRFPAYRPVATFDPAQVNYAFDNHLIRQIFDRMLKFDEAAGRIVPCVAHHWTANEDATQWTFYLRKGVRFHNGQELTARDVAYSLERLGGTTYNRWLVRGIQQMELLSPWVLRIHLKQPNRIFDRYMCSGPASILPADLSGMEESEFWKLPVGTGPFRMISQSEHCIELAAHGAYYAGRPYLDGVDVIIMPEECLDAAIEMPDVLHQDFKDNHPVQRQMENWQTLKKLCRGSAMMTWNLRRQGPQQSEAFRRAVRMILNTRELVNELGGDRVLPAFGFRPDPSRSVEPLLPERVRAALKESHYDGTPIRFVAHEKNKEDACWIVDRLSRWEIVVELKLLTWAESLGCGPALDDQDLMMHGFVLAEDEACEIEAYEHGDSIFKSYLDDELLGWIHQQIDAALSAETEPQRRQHLKMIEEHLRDSATVIFLHHRELRASFHPSIRGVSLNTLGWIDFKDIWLEKMG